LDSGSIQREGLNLSTGVFAEFHKAFQAGMVVPTCKEWREEMQIATRGQRESQQKLGTVKEIDGVNYWEDTYMGVKVLLTA
jgi:hypothetical protein